VLETQAAFGLENAWLTQSAQWSHFVGRSYIVMSEEVKQEISAPDTAERLQKIKLPRPRDIIAAYDKDRDGKISLPELSPENFKDDFSDIVWRKISWLANKVGLANDQQENNKLTKKEVANILRAKFQEIAALSNDEKGQDQLISVKDLETLSPQIFFATLAEKQGMSLGDFLNQTNIIARDIVGGFHKDYIANAQDPVSGLKRAKDLSLQLAVKGIELGVPVAGESSRLAYSAFDEAYGNAIIANDLLDKEERARKEVEANVAKDPNNLERVKEAKRAMGKIPSDILGELENVAKTQPNIAGRIYVFLDRISGTPAEKLDRNALEALKKPSEEEIMNTLQGIGMKQRAIFE
jgi:hypothetical protein